MPLKRQISKLVFNMTSHEGNPLTFDEVDGLINSKPVIGHSLNDIEQVHNIHHGWITLFKLLKAKEFEVSKKMICELHAIYAKNEALKWGEFRDNHISISGTNYQPPIPEKLNEVFEGMLKDYSNNLDKEDAAFNLFLTCAASQFFYDGNKRAGQFLMNGVRLSHGLAVITIPPNKDEEYNSKMIHFYDSSERNDIKLFLKTCVLGD